MLTLPIEAEIEQEHKVIRNLNKRQTACACVIAITGMAAYAVTKDVMYALAVTAPVALVLAYVGWKVTSGLNAEEIIWLKLRRWLYKDGVRKYRTRNSYFGLMNAGYAKLKAADMADPKKAKRIARAAKKSAKKAASPKQNPRMIA